MEPSFQLHQTDKEPSPEREASTSAHVGPGGARKRTSCQRCRRLKKTCEGTDAPCARCKRAKVECVFDKVSSETIDDPGLERLSAIEAQLSTNERRVDSIISTLGEVVRLLGAGGSGASLGGKSRTPGAFSEPSPAALSDHAPQGATPYGPGGSTGSHSAYNPPSNPPTFPAFRAISGTLSGSQGAGGATHDSFASSLDTPIRALAEAAAQEAASYASGTGGTAAPLAPGAAGATNGPSPGQDGEPPRKRIKTEDGLPFGAPEKPLTSADKGKGQHTLNDLVGKGLIGDREARSLVLLWMKELRPYCAVLDPSYDTYPSLRRRSSFLFNAILFTALRARTGAGPAAKELVAAAEQTKREAQDRVFLPNPETETVQALLLMACWHEEPYILTGHALRMALAARLDRTHETIRALGGLAKSGRNQRTRDLTAQLRLWLYLHFLEFKHARSTGRMILLLQGSGGDEGDPVGSYADELLASPFALPEDVRLVANLKLTLLQREQVRFAESCERKLGQDGVKNFEEKVEYIRAMREKIVEWHARYDALLANMAPDPASWLRRSQQRHLHDAYFFLSCTVLKQSLLDPSSPANVLQLAYEALKDARLCLQTLLLSPAYLSSAKYSGYMTRVDVTFASLTAMRLAGMFQGLADKDELAGEVLRVAQAIGECPGTQRYYVVLRTARDEFLQQQLQKEEANAIVSPQTSIAAAASAAASSAASATLPPPSSNQAAASTSPAPVPFQSASASGLDLDAAPPGTGWSTPSWLADYTATHAPTNGALLPGEIDWTAFDFTGSSYGAQQQAFAPPAAPAYGHGGGFDPVAIAGGLGGMGIAGGPGSGTFGFPVPPLGNGNGNGGMGSYANGAGGGIRPQQPQTQQMLMNMLPQGMMYGGMGMGMMPEWMNMSVGANGMRQGQGPAGAGDGGEPESGWTPGDHATGSSGGGGY